MRRRKTDYGTIILHWLLVAAFGVAFVSGMRIATEAPERAWINWFDSFLPQNVWVIHMQAAVVLVTVSVAYTIYILRSGLGRRIRLDKVRLRGLVGRGQARRGAANIVLYWIFFVTMLALMGSGGLMYFGYFAGYDMATLHWYGTWVILGFAGLHVLSHLGIGGTSQLLRIFRPTGLLAPPPQLDAVELLTLLVEQSARLQPESELADKASPEAHVQPVPRPKDAERPKDTARSRPAVRNSTPPLAPGAAAKKPAPGTAGKSTASKPRSTTFQSNPFVVAAAVAITGASIMVAADRMAVDQLLIHRINNADAPILDGDTSDRAWRNIQPFSLTTNQGGNFDGKGESKIDPRGRPNFPREPSSNPRTAGHHDRPRPAFYARRRRLCRRVAMEGYKRRFDRLDGRRSLRSADRCNAQAGAQYRPVQRRVRARSGYRELFRQFYHERRARCRRQTVDHAASVAEGSCENNRGDGGDRHRSKSWRERRSTLVHDGDGIDTVFVGTGCPHPVGDSCSRRHHRRRILGRSRGRPMCGPLGLRALGAGGGASSRHQKPIRRSASDRSLHAGRGLRSQSDQAYPARAANSS